ncbi:fatty acid hydroxylase superfamily-domain-containing protein [Geopyxis carbonaria]|nr:fatty acid hydroxylase superfamily-domain-containing protein [Geopyxis carbonaria]
MISATNATLPTLTPLPPVLPPIPDSILLLALPILTYWILSLFWHYLDTNDLLPQYRLHTPEEVLKRNHVTRREVVREVIVQQIIQTIVGGTLSLFEGVNMTGMEQGEILALYSKFLAAERWGIGALALGGIDGAGLEKKAVEGVVALGGGKLLASALAMIGLPTGDEANWKLSLVELAYWYIIPALRMWVAIFVLDTWQYFLHRLMHEVKWLYKTFHSRHHRLYVPYAFGALYNHPFEGLLMDSIGASLAYKVAGLGVRGGMVFFSFSTMKTVDDHCGYSLPWDPLQKIFWNNAGYHDVHHQSWGIKTNYSQPFLICWDRWLGTQWTGGDVSARYAASRAKAAAACAADQTNGALVAHPSQKSDITNSGATNGSSNGVTNGNGSARPRIPNGKPAQQARDSRTQAGEEVVAEETSEEVKAEESLRRSVRKRTPRVR